ncbi:ribulose-phosphate 3-epimerase [Paenibacillus nasutitermitis]|uniref:Ribulose-phosphate 3-epimerase n=1 Tax=Paenibacillus nasutitermitis TaxID=1652958 RepID=A0A917DYN1_9BACL|nr:ribulose-phosphate 3-epimerase [Paenibacillus nasutitermitis]GGD80078.1 ribulose-phosphate 3-epimerase [Paenibacillus nasutitermitis]
MGKIGPSLMCADLGRLLENIHLLDQAEVDFYHFDIMDGNFVPNIALGPDLLRALRPHTDKPFDAHLMVEEPERFIELIAEAGADMISIHSESKVHLQRALQRIRSYGLKAGVALNPSTPLCMLDYVMDCMDYVCVMTVNPGFAGQKFIPSTLRKIKDLRQKIDRENPDISIEVDGNISNAIIPEVISNGAEMLVCGTSSIFIPGQPLEHSVRQVKALIEQAG